jgi:pyrroloquinoline quinone (PQQ) biosynthesis protein C
MTRLVEQRIKVIINGQKNSNHHKLVTKYASPECGQLMYTLYVIMEIYIQYNFMKES